MDTQTPQTTPQPEQPPQLPTEGGISKSAIIAIALVGVLVLAGGMYYFSKPQTPSPSVTNTQNPVSTTRSKAPGVVTALTTATAIDVKGAAVGSSSVFKTTDKNIYLVATLTAPKVGTKIEYIRYLNGKYLDSGALQISKAGVSNASFVWSLKTATSKRPPGTYRVKVYTSGVFEKEISFVVR